MKPFNGILLVFLMMGPAACFTKKTTTMEEAIKTQRLVIDSLLKSSSFGLSIAKAQDTAYYRGIGEPVPPFLTPAEDTALIKKSVKEEKIATSLAGFYALECGIGLLCKQTGEKPADWLQKIVTDKIDSAAALLLNRFANATWKAGQPFRAMERIQRPVFTVAGLLPEEEVKKDFYQIKTAATKLLASLQEVKDSTTEVQMQKIRSLLHSQAYAAEMAAFMSAGHASNTQQPAVDSFITAKEDTATILKSAKDQKTATNLAGLYAVECGTDYLVTTRNLSPAAVLRSITENSISEADKDLFLRFANATWKAGQPFRSLSRIERDTFTPFYFLNAADIDKDWVQIKTAAAGLLAAL